MDNKQQLSFEQAMEKLEDIVARLESGNLPLADMVSAYEEGMVICKHCTSLLDEYGAKIEMIRGAEQTSPEGK